MGAAKTDDRAERRAFRTPVSLYASVEGPDGDSYPCFVTSISGRGIYLDSPGGFHGVINSRCWVRLKLPGTEKLLSFSGHVIATKTGQLFEEAAVRFEWIPPQDRNVLLAWLITRRGRRSGVFPKA